MTSPLAVEAPSAPQCSQHPMNGAVTVCVRCERPVCHVCVFTIGSATYCPVCVRAGPSGEEAAAAFNKGLISIVLAVVGFAITGEIFLQVFPLNETAKAAISFPWLGASLAGVALALVARDGARRRGSVLPTIGLVANGLLVAIQAVSTVYGNLFAR